MSELDVESARRRGITRTAGRAGIASRSLALSAIVGCALFLAACGSSDSSTSSSTPAATSGTSGESSVVADARKALAAISGPNGAFTSPPTTGPKATPGKSVFVISFGQGVPYFARQTDELQAAAKKLGWKMTIWDGKFQPNLWLAGVRQALTSKADGVIGLGPDCPPLKPGLLALAKAKIPYISVEGWDCNELDPKAKSLFSWTVTYNEGSLREWATTGGKYQADWTIARTNGKAKVVAFEETDAFTFRSLIDGFNNELKKCSGCAILSNTKLLGTDYGPKLQQKAQQALLAAPEANIVFPSGSETVLGAGVAAAIRTSQNKPVSTGFEGDSTAPGNFKSGALGMSLNVVPGWEAFAALDALVRLFAGEQPTKETGMGFRLIDKEHNFDTFKPYEAPLDYKSVYYKTWGVG